VTVLCLGNPEQEKRLKDRLGHACAHIEFVSHLRPKVLRLIVAAGRLLSGRSSFFRRVTGPEVGTAVGRLVARHRFDAAFFSTVFFGYNSLPSGMPLIGDTQNVEYDNLFRAFLGTKNPVRRFYYYLEHRIGKREELENCRKFDVILTTSERDRGVFRRDLPDMPMEVIPNGVDLEYFSPPKAPVEPRTIVFTGLMNYYPNENAVLFFLDEVLPLVLSRCPGARIFVVGANPSRQILARSSDHVIVTGYVDDVRSYVARAEVSAVPILIGGGTRLKVLESMAMKKAIVTTTIGCEGINLVHEESALFADTPKDFASAILRLFTDPLLRDRLAEQAYKNVIQEYGWEAIGARLDRVYRMLGSTHEQPERAAGEVLPG
jgi:glycosyltransferase involved in cell wall biosynthesis